MHELVSGVIDFDSLLPAWPFVMQRASVSVLESGLLYSEEACAAFKALASYYGDSRIAWVTYESQLMQTGFEITAAHWVSPTDLDRVGRDLLDVDKGCVGITAEHVVITGSTRAWAVYASADWDWVILAAAMPEPQIVDKFPLRPVAEAVADFFVPGTTPNSRALTDLDAFVQSVEAHAGNV